MPRELLGLGRRLVAGYAALQAAFGRQPFVLSAGTAAVLGYEARTLRDIRSDLGRAGWARRLPCGRWRLVYSDRYVKAWLRRGASAAAVAAGLLVAACVPRSSAAGGRGGGCPAENAGWRALALARLGALAGVSARTAGRWMRAGVAAGVVGVRPVVRCGRRKYNLWMNVDPAAGSVLAGAAGSVLASGSLPGGDQVPGSGAARAGDKCGTALEAALRRQGRRSARRAEQAVDVQPGVGDGDGVGVTWRARPVRRWWARLLGVYLCEPEAAPGAAGHLALAF